jgi:type II secretory pathway pseudopilin PulG
MNMTRMMPDTFHLPPRPLRCGRYGFTIVELLMVITIMMLMMGLGYLGFISISKGANVKNALLQVKSGTSIAREKAVTSRQRVFFLVPTQVVTDNNYVRSNMVYSSYLLASEVTGGIASPSTIIGRAESFPEGVVFKTDTLNATGWSSVDILDTNGVTLFRGRGFRYAPTGSIYYKDQEKFPSGVGQYSIVITEGDVSAGGTLTYRNNPIVSTALVHTVSGRCTLP